MLLAFVIAVLAFLASLAAVGALASSRAADGWRRELAGSATVVVRASGLESPDAAAARAAEVLAGVDGVAEARALAPETGDALIARFVGPDGLPKDVPVPRLVAVEFKSHHPARIDDLRAALGDDGINAEVEDHRVWTDQIRRSARIAAWSAGGLFALLIAAAAAMIGFAARQGLEGRRDVVEALHLAGASDPFLASALARDFALIAVVAGAAGAAAAALLAAMAGAAGDSWGLAAELPVRWSDLAAVIPSPLIAAAASALAAGLAAREALARIP